MNVWCVSRVQVYLRRGDTHAMHLRECWMIVNNLCVRLQFVSSTMLKSGFSYANTHIYTCCYRQLVIGERAFKILLMRHSFCLISINDFDGANATSPPFQNQSIQVHSTIGAVRNRRCRLRKRRRKKKRNCSNVVKRA